MSKKLKKAIRDSFSFPETAHKDEFFGQLLLSENCQHRRNVPFRFTAAAAAIVLGAGIWNAVKLRPDTEVIDIPDDMPAETEIISTEPFTQNAATTTAEDNITVRTTTAFSEKKKTTSTLTETTNTKETTNKKNAVTSADVQVTVSVTSAPYVSTETTAVITESVSDIERSFSMKKISAFAASFVIAASNVSVLPSNADSANGDFFEFMREDHCVYEAIIDSTVKKLSEKESELDINEDGSFDMWDVYAFYRGMNDHNNHGEYIWNELTKDDTFIPPVFTAPEYITENVVENGDLNGDGEIDKDDFEILAYYYSINYHVTYDFVDPNNYYYNCPDNYDDSQYSYAFTTPDDLWTRTRIYDLDLYMNPNPIVQFVFDFVEYNMRVYGGYDIFCDMVDRGIIDLDINGDGEITINDLYDSFEGNILCYWESFPEYGEDNEEHEVARNTYFTEEEWIKLRNNSNLTTAALSYAFEENAYYVNYFCEHYGFKKAYADRHFFDDMRGGFYSISAYTNMFDYLKFSMPGIYSPRFDYTQDEIKADFVNYYTAVKNGKLPEPDINMNGTIEFEDYIYADLMLRADSFGNDPKYPDFDKAIIDNYKKNCDFNENLLSGDLSDVISIQLYVVKELGIPEDEVRNEVARYYKKHPEMDVWDYEHYVLPEELPEFDGSAKAETGITAIRTYMSNIDLFILRNGDANNDGETDMADAVLIMQTYANPDKYELTDKGSFNADIFSTGDGVTPKDAQKIQMILLGME